MILGVSLYAFHASAATSISATTISTTSVSSTNLDTTGNTTLGDATSDTHTINGTVIGTLPDNSTNALDIQEGTNDYINVNTTNGSERVKVGSSNSSTSIELLTGAPTASNTNGGDILLTLGAGSGSGRQGVITPSAANGDIRFKNNGTGVLRIEDSGTTAALTLDHDGVDGIVTATTGSVKITAGVLTNTINSTSATAVGQSTVTLQNQTLNVGAALNAVIVQPSFAAGNFFRRGLTIAATQNGTNTSALIGIDVNMAKATAATTLGTMDGIRIEVPSIEGTVTTSNGINIQAIGGTATNSNGINILDQTGPTNARAITINGTAKANAISWGASALQYSNGIDNIRFMGSTDARGIDFTLNDLANQTIATSAGNLELGVAGTSELTLTATALSPTTTDGNALGTAALMWGDLFLASGGVVNFNNGNLALTHSNDNLTLDVGTGVGQMTFDGSTGGCLMLRDTDDAGWTEVDALDGVLTASIDADGICD